MPLHGIFILGYNKRKHKRCQIGWTTKQQPWDKLSTACAKISSLRCTKLWLLTENDFFKSATFFNNFHHSLKNRFLVGRLFVPNFIYTFISRYFHYFVYALSRLSRPSLSNCHIFGKHHYLMEYPNLIM